MKDYTLYFEEEYAEDPMGRSHVVAHQVIIRDLDTFEDIARVRFTPELWAALGLPR